MTGSDLPPIDGGAPDRSAGAGMAHAAPAGAGPAAPVPGAPRWMRSLLVASLAANLLVVGLVAGTAIVRVRHGPVQMQVRDLSIGPFTSALTPEDRDALRQEFMGRAGSGPRMGAELRRDFADFLAALRAVPYDPAATAAVFDRFRMRNLERLSTGEELLQARITAMSPEARAAFADRIEKGLKPSATTDHGTRREAWREERREERRGD